jgi:DNA-binding NarL/FixJ family response regulator
MVEGVKRIVLAEDQTILREGIRTILSSQKDVEVVGEAEDGLELTQRVHEWDPNLILLDLSMPKLTGISAIGEIKRQCPSVKIMVLTVHDSEEFIVAAFEAGADGYCLKDCTRNELIDAIDRVLSGKRYISPGIADQVLDGYLQGREPRVVATHWDDLTERERQVLKLIAEGNKNTEIADILCISTRTVEKHRANIMDKLDLHNVADLTAYAMRKGLIPT